MNRDEDSVTLTPQQWQYISVLIASDVREDKFRGFNNLVALHLPIWEKIQPACKWDDEEDDNDR